MCLTSQTSDALSRTLRGVIAVIKTLLQNGVHYVLTGDLTDERLEGEFGVFRGLNGDNNYMGADHVQNCLKLQRIKLFARLDSDNISLEHTESDCCKQDLSEKE
jgi:hypothetical protein